MLNKLSIQDNSLDSEPCLNQSLTSLFPIDSQLSSYLASGERERERKREREQETRKQCEGKYQNWPG
jgi:hypothetical protein